MLSPTITTLHIVYSVDPDPMFQDHNENGHTPLMEAASAGHCTVARILLEFGAGINTHSNEFKVKMMIS